MEIATKPLAGLSMPIFLCTYLDPAQQVNQQNTVALQRWWWGRRETSRPCMLERSLMITAALWSPSVRTYAWHGTAGPMVFRTHVQGSDTCRPPAWAPHGYMPFFPDLGLSLFFKQKIPIN